MILQPFIENAINHGLRYKETKGNLYIQFYNQGKYLVCRIKDDGVGRERARQIQAKSRKGYQSQGLKITEERLRTFNMIADSDIRFSISDCIELEDEDDNTTDVGTLIEIKFPKFG
jgi:sensor histidine kinase YesM